MISWIIFKCFFGLRITGSKNLPKSGPFIVVANHSSVFDGFILASSIKPKITFMAAAYLFKINFYRYILQGVGAIPVQRNGSDIFALKKSIEILKQGDILGIFPEGRMKNKEDSVSAKAGAAYLAVKTNVPIVPIAIKGADKALPVGKKWPKFSRIEVQIGKPIITSKALNINKKNIEKIVNIYMKEIN
ncbi:MAG: lysophospholipid acyltransferase family protein [Candidatus Caldatribacteriota bacterium]|nr:lysophospholipid acyltransferase family protein [Candidatus Caldatribacteriota bacterium]